MTDPNVYARPREWRGVRFSEDSVAEISGRTIVVSIQRRDVQHIILRHGLKAQHPLLQASAGVLLACASIAIPTFYYLDASRRGGVFILAPAAFLIAAVFGIVVAWKAVRRGYFLEVTFEGGSRKLKFRHLPRIEDVENFLTSIEASLGYTIERGVKTSGFPIAKT